MKDHRGASERLLGFILLTPSQLAPERVALRRILTLSPWGTLVSSALIQYGVKHLFSK